MIYIFDLDGTLADCEHRRHWLDKDQHPELASDERWARFFDPQEIAKDEPMRHVLNVLISLRYTAETIWIWSARPERVREATEAWLMHASTGCAFRPWGELCDVSDNHQTLRMRPDGDFRPDAELKQEWLLGLPESIRRCIGTVFDDRQSVVDMWRRNGIPCFQVAPGNF